MPTDAELLEKFRQTNDAAAFAELARRYRTMVFVTARRITGDRHDAEDVAQSCFLELARRAPEVRTAPAGFLHSAATNYARNVLRERARRRKHLDLAATEAGERVQDGGAAAHELKWEEFAPEVDAAIEELPEKYRVPIILSYLRGMSETEVAVELGISRGRLVGRLQVGVRRLRARLAKGGSIVAAGVLTMGLASQAHAAVPPSLTANLGRLGLIGLCPPPRVARSTRRARRTTLLAGVGTVWLWWLGAGVMVGGGIAGVWWWSSAHRSASVGPYDQLRAVYGPFMSTSFSWRTSGMTRSPTMFWRGAQPLFFDWCRTNATDWLADRDVYLPCLASPYLPDALSLPEYPDSANSARLPFQLELLQAMVARRIEYGTIDDPNRFELDRKMFDAYLNALGRPAQGTGRRRAVTAVAGTDAPELDRYTDRAGGLRRIVYSASGNVEEVLRPIRETASLASALGTALRNDARFAGMFNGDGSDWLATHLASAATRIHVKAGASQGLASILVLLRGARSGSGGDALVELREITPSAAELANCVPADGRVPARRAWQDARDLSPRGLPASWCTYDGTPMLVRLHRAPLGHRVANSDAAELPERWGTAIGHTHQPQTGNLDLVRARMTPALLSQLGERADAYVRQQAREQMQFDKDKRCELDAAQVNAETSAALVENRVATTTKGTSVRSGS